MRVHALFLAVLAHFVFISGCCRTILVMHLQNRVARQVCSRPSSSFQVLPRPPRREPSGTWRTHAPKPWSFCLGMRLCVERTLFLKGFRVWSCVLLKKSQLIVETSYHPTQNSTKNGKKVTDGPWIDKPATCRINAVLQRNCTACYLGL